MLNFYYAVKANTDGSGSLLAVLPAEQGNAVDAFGPELVRISDAPAGLGATDCCRWAARPLHNKHPALARSAILAIL
jgi:hypothetical protein